MKNKIVYGLLILSSIFLASGCGMQGGNSSFIKTEQKSYAEIAEILKKYKIDGVTEELINEFEASASEIPPEIELNKTAMLLSALGCGDYNYEEGTWQPYSNGVYSFDVEVYDVEKMYTNFLLGVSALDKDELDFKNIQEDTGDVDWDEGTGKRTVTFEWKGQTFCLEAEAMYDWFDMNVVADLNKIIIENGNDKRLFCTDDGYQECIIFYRDKDWASAFQKDTGLVLSEF